MTPAPVATAAPTMTPKPATAPVMTPAPVMSTAPKTVSPSVISAAPAIEASKAAMAGVAAADQQMAAQAALRASQPGSTALATLASPEQISPTRNAQGLTMAEMVARANGQAPTPAPGTTAGAPGSVPDASKPNMAPPGWDAATYANFKAANPDLEPNAEDTRRMMNATSGTQGSQPGSYAQASAKAAADFEAHSSAVLADSESAFNQFKTSIDQIQNGTFPLSPDQQAQLDDIKAQFQGVIEAQKQANTAYEQAVRVSGVRAGRDMYAPRVNAGNIQKAVSDGVARIGDINVKMASALATAKSAIKADNMKALGAVYDAFTKLQEQKSKEISDLYGTVKDTLAATRQEHADALEEAKFSFEVEQAMNKPAIDAGLDEAKTINNLAFNYPDANIDPLNDSLLSAQQKVTASASWKAAQEKETDATIRRYQFARNQGYDGTLIDFMTMESAGTDATTPVTKEINGETRQWNPVTQSWDVPSTSGAPKVNLEKQAALQEKIGLIDSLLRSPGKDSSVGTYAIERWTPFTPDKGVREAFKAGVQQLINNATVDTLLDIKAQGGTFGALSEKELDLLQSSATKLKSWENKDGLFDVSIADFDNELRRIKQATLNALDITQGIDFTDPDFNQLLQSDAAKGKTRKQVWDALGKTNEGSASGNAQIQDVNLGGKTAKVAGTIADKLASADRDFYEATGQHLQVNQSFRTHEEQAALYKELSAKGARVAPPGKSFHEKGLAVDVTNWKDAEKYLRKYGLVNDLSDDRGHFSFGETNA